MSVCNNRKTHSKHEWCERCMPQPIWSVLSGNDKEVLSMGGLRSKLPSDIEKTSEAKKFDHKDQKLRFDLLPYDALVEEVKVMNCGAVKYGDRNWEKGMAWSRLFGAAMRHLVAWFCGEKNDPETGLSHLAHAACCVHFLLAWELRGAGTDDRPEAMKWKSK